MVDQKPPFEHLPTLQTERLILRETLLSDAPDVLIFRSDPIEQQFNSEPMTHVSQAEALIVEFQDAYRKGVGFLWGVTLKPANTVVGLINYLTWNRDHRADLGHDIARAYWGQGIGPEAVREVVRFGFEQMGLNGIEALTLEHNLSSRKLLDKVGFVLEGIRREWNLDERTGEYDGSCVYALLKSDYRSRMNLSHE